MKKLLHISALAALLLAAGPAGACPNCRSAVVIDDQGAPASQERAGDYSSGINYSIYFMIGSIYAVFGGLTLLLMRRYREYEPGMTPGGPVSRPPQVPSLR